MAAASASMPRTNPKPTAPMTTGSHGKGFSGGSRSGGGAVTAGRATGGDAAGDDGAALGVGAGAGGEGGSGGGGAVLVAACRFRSAIARASSGSSGRPLMVESGFQGAGAPGSRCCRAGMPCPSSTLCRVDVVRVFRSTGCLCISAMQLGWCPGAPI